MSGIDFLDFRGEGWGSVTPIFPIFRVKVRVGIGVQWYHFSRLYKVSVRVRVGFQWYQFSRFSGLVLSVLSVIDFLDFRG